MKVKNLFSIILWFLTLLPVLSANGSYGLLRKSMVEKQLLEQGITDRRILDAFQEVERHLFVNPALRYKAYGDFALPIGEDQYIQQPYIVAIMTYVIAPAYNKKVLEIGTGSGYHAAILAHLVKNVFTIEIMENLAKTARERLLSMGYKNIVFKTGNGYLGWEKHAPFDGIIVTCSPDHIPPPLIEQLAVGGRMVIPIRYTQQVQELILIEKDKKGQLKRTNLIPVQFVPMIRGKKQ